MAKVVQDEAGQLFVDQGGGTLTPVTEDQAIAFQRGTGALAGAGQAVAQGTENLITGAGSLLSDSPYWQQANQEGRARSEALNLANPVTSAAAQMAPQAAIGLGAAAAAPAGLLGTGVVAGTEAALGAATTPESPIEGALIGGALGAAGELAPSIGRAGWRASETPRNWVANKLGFGEQALPDAATMNPGGLRPGERPPFPGDTAPAPGASPLSPDAGAAGAAGAEVPPPSPSANPPGAQANPAPRMADRVAETLNTVDRETAPANMRALEGTMSPRELYDLGIDISPGQNALLRAQAGTNDAYLAQAKLREEQLLMSAPTQAGEARRMLDYNQQQAATNFITRELGLPQGVNLTDHVLADTIQNVGSRMDDIATEMGAMPITKEVQDEFAGILQETTGSHKTQLNALVDEINAKATNNGGVLTGDDWSEMRTKISRMIEAGTRQGSIGKVSDAGALLDTMTDLMESGLPDATRAELAELRRQYAIASTLNKAGTRNADGQVNPVSFYSNWKRPQSKANRGQDAIGRFMNTMVTLTKKRVPDSGTAPRLLSNLVDVGLDLVPGGGIAKRVMRGVQ